MKIRGALILDAGSYKPGDLPPEGYCQWHEWAEVQRKAGIKQVMCPRCMRWKTPQELSDQTETTTLYTTKRGGKAITKTSALCTKCCTKG